MKKKSPKPNPKAKAPVKPKPVSKKKIRKRPVKGGNDRDPEEDFRDDGSFWDINPNMDDDTYGY